jgi:Mn2+/Fe2+ NRAMP family transporter
VRRGLSGGLGDASRFFTVARVSIAFAIVVALAGVSVLCMLVAASIIGGLATPLGLAVLIGLARDKRVIRRRPIPLRLAASGWTVAGLVGALGLTLAARDLIGAVLRT